MLVASTLRLVPTQEPVRVKLTHHFCRLFASSSIVETISNNMGSVFGKESVAEPPFTVLLERTSAPTTYQLRQYGTRMAAETRMDGDNRNSAFRALATYIGVFGKPMNEGAKAIAMTAPVVMERGGGTAIAMTAPVVMSSGDKSEGEMMQFMLPVEYDSMDKVPKPTNSAVRIKELPPSVGVAHRYAGSLSTPEETRKIAMELVKQVQQDGVSGLKEDDALANYQFWGYNPPFTLPMFRRNEVWIPLTKEQADELVQSVGDQKLN